MVLNDFGPLGRAYIETDEANADEATIIENILSGQYSHPVRVVAFKTVEGWARDVTEDIAQAVLSKAQTEGRSVSIAAQEFLARMLGVWMRPFVGDCCHASRRRNHIQAMERPGSPSLKAAAGFPLIPNRPAAI